MMDKTHCMVVEEAINRINYKELNKHKKIIIKACMKTDWPKIFKININGKNHFYNPYTKKGFFIFKNAKDKAIESYYKAISSYNINKKESFVFLGKSLHYLADLATPAHTKIASHFFNTDNFENFVEENLGKLNFRKFKVNFADKIENYFEKLAKISCKFNVVEKGFFKGLKECLFGIKNMNYKELEEQAKVLVPMAVSYSIVLLKKFYIDIKI